MTSRASCWLNRLGAVAAATALLLGGAPASAAYTGLYVLGDSLSDNGNLHAATGFPPAPYDQGRFSNGPVAVEHVASGLGLGGARFHDLAIGGARTGLNGSGGVGTGMLSQLVSFQASLGGGAADADALYFVWGGANDLFDGLSANNVAGAIATAVGNLTTLVSTLHTLGARHFLLPNLADLGLTPQIRAGGVAAQAAASAATDLFNTQLDAAYDVLASGWSDETFIQFDTATEHRALTAAPAGHGLSNVSDACLPVLGGPVCATPSTYLYWDLIHPSAVTHQVLGTQMANVVAASAVPEPTSLPLMAGGALLLLGLRRRPARRG